MSGKPIAEIDEVVSRGQEASDHEDQDYCPMSTQVQAEAAVVPAEVESLAANSREPVGSAWRFFRILSRLASDWPSTLPPLDPF